MYEFHSLIYKIETEDGYEDIAVIKKWLILVVIQISQNTMTAQRN